MLHRPMVLAAVMACFAVWAAPCGANVFQMPNDQTSLVTVAIGDAGNADDSTGYGGVGYAYRMSTYEITAAQYTEFLNAVAATDSHGLYKLAMFTNDNGCKIERTGNSGEYHYEVSAGNANRPVNYVSWRSAIRFVNWVQNGQTSGGTESGAYTITDDIVSARSSLAQWVLPNEDEWYKAAYYNAATNSYWAYPTASNATPGNDLTEATHPGNNANYLRSSTPNTTNVGTLYLSDSAYGTFDQGGNVSEWTESIFTRGGAVNGLASDLATTGRADYTGSSSTFSAYSIGFRVAYVPEPGTWALLAIAVALTVAYRRARPTH